MDANTNMIVDVRAFGRILGPILLSFVGSRFITQTDIMMLAPLGQDAVGAYSIPARVMLIDTIFALALGPIVSVNMAKANDHLTRALVIRNTLSLGLYLGLFLSTLGLVFYPQITDSLVDNKDVATLAQGAVLCLTLAIPIRLMQFLGLMLLYGSGRGNEIVPVIVLSIILNAALNWLFIYHLDFGFTGCYVATIMTAAAELVVLVRLLSREGTLTSFILKPEIRWIRNVFHKGGAEWGRLVSYQLVNLTLLSIFAAGHEWNERLTLFAIATEFQALLFIPMIAVMRTSAIVLASRPELQTPSHVYLALRHVAIVGFILAGLLGFLLNVIDNQAWSFLYGISGTVMMWWHPFLVIVAITIPVYFLNSLQRGVWQSREKFGFLFSVDATTQWLILVPVVYIGVTQGNAWLTWSGWLLVEVVVAFILFFNRRGLNSCENATQLDSSALPYVPARPGNN